MANHANLNMVQAMNAATLAHATVRRAHAATKVAPTTATLQCAASALQKRGRVATTARTAKTHNKTAAPAKADAMAATRARATNNATAQPAANVVSAGNAATMAATPGVNVANAESVTNGQNVNVNLAQWTRW